MEYLISRSRVMEWHMPLDAQTLTDLSPGGWMAYGSSVPIHGIQLLFLGVAATIFLVILIGGRVYRQWDTARLREFAAQRDAELVSPNQFLEGAPAAIQVPSGTGLWSGSSVVRAIEKRWITLTAPSEDSERLVVSMPVAVTIQGESALFRFQSRIADRKVVDGVPTLVVAKPVWMEKVQRREYFRIGVHLPTALTLRGAENGESVRGTIDNLSAGGFRIAVNEKLQDGAVFRVRIPAEALSGYTFDARVIRCTAARDFGPLRYRAHCEFLHLTEDNRSLIVSYCFDVQREMRQSLQ
jgi:c-di-GMP-binding flagellar brake protein YcgR